MSQRPPQSSNLAISNTQNSSLRRLRRLGYLLDNAIPIPGTPYRVGLDPLIGLLPGGGDLLASIISIYIVFEAARLRTPRGTLIQMVLNILLETVLGSVPVLGDLFDAGWKANSKNVALLESHLDTPSPKKRTDWLFIVLLLGGLIAVVIVMSAISISILLWLLRVINS
ncbi:MAG: DUF4112 domain-containing protein [Coleofasciculaceae cyanobacterium]